MIPPPNHTDVCPCCIFCLYFPLGTFLQGTDFGAVLHHSGAHRKLRESGFSSSCVWLCHVTTLVSCYPLTVAWSSHVGMVPIQVSDGRQDIGLCICAGQDRLGYAAVTNTPGSQRLRRTKGYFFLGCHSGQPWCCSTPPSLLDPG